MRVNGFAKILLLVGLAALSPWARARHHRAPAGPQKMFLVQIQKDTDSLKVHEVAVVKYPGRDKQAGTPGGEGSWYCEIAGKEGKVVWSGFLANPFLDADSVPASGAKPRVGVIRLPYRSEFTAAKVYSTMTGPVPIPDRKAAILAITLAAAPEN
jgi:hypothetical protein